MRPALPVRPALLLLLVAGCSGTIALDTPHTSGSGSTSSSGGGSGSGSGSGSGGSGSGGSSSGASYDVTIDAARAQVPAADALASARAIAPMLIGRTLTAAERTQLQAGGAVALRTLLEGWVAEAGFVEMARDLFSVRLKASGSSTTLDGTLPGNLAAYLVKNRRPHAELVTATSCRSASGDAIPCGSGAPFEAGVLTTRVFLANNAYRFNLKRARTVLQAFACAEYPLREELQPRLPKAALLEMFQNDLPPEDNIFGNGNACYTCHSQFGAHAQAFVKFDGDGRYQANATGQQLTGGEAGVSSTNPRLFASHLLDARDAASEATQYFGKQVANLAELGRALSDNPIFLKCAVRSVMAYVLALSQSEANAVPGEVVEEIVSEARKLEPEPTLARLVVETFSHPSLVMARRSP